MDGRFYRILRVEIKARLLPLLISRINFSIYRSQKYSGETCPLVTKRFIRMVTLHKIN